MSRNIETATAPSAWSSYLINGDDSGMEIDDKVACDSWIAAMEWGWPVSCENVGFHRFHDALKQCPLAADCEEYSFLVES